MADRTVLHAHAKDALQKRDWATAVGICVVLRTEYPDFEAGYSIAILALRNMGLFEMSDALAREAIASFGIEARYLRTMADTAMDQRDWASAVGRWAELRARFPERPEGYYRAVAALLSLDHHIEAMQVAQLGSIVLPDEPLVHLAKIDCLVHQDDMKAAAKELESLRVNFPDSDRVFLKSLTITHKMGNATAALPLARVAFERFGTETFAQMYYRSYAASVPDTQGLITLAKVIYDQGLRITATQGAHRLFDLAETDTTLTKIIDGKRLAYEPLPADRPIRALFYFPTVTQTDNLLPLVQFMAKDNRFYPIILCSRNNSRASDDSFTFFNAMFEGTRVEVVDGGDHIDNNISPYELSPDIVFYHTPYSKSANYPFFLKADFVARHTRVMHVNYGYFLLTMGAGAEHIYDNPHVRVADMVFTESQVSQSIYERSYPRETLHLTGYPKFDAFRKHLTLGSYEERITQKEKLKVIWTPHWQTPEDPNGGTHTSNFLRYLDVLMSLAMRGDINLHIRPHPLLRARLPSLNLMSYEEYDAVMDKFEACGATIHPANEGASYIPTLMDADVLISDFSSLIPEFFISERPIIFCHTEDVWNNGKWISDFGKMLISEGCYSVSDETALLTIFNKITKGRSHPKQAAMRQLIKKYNLFPEGSACRRICDAIEARVR